MRRPVGGISQDWSTRCSGPRSRVLSTVPPTCTKVVNSVTGEPIARARVSVNSVGSASSTATDSSGRWTLSNIACAPGQVQATRRADFCQRTTPTPGWRRISTPGVGFRFTGSRFKDRTHPAVCSLGKSAGRSGRPGNGRTSHQLLASRVQDGRPRFQQAGMGVTNDLGEYRVASLPSGKYILCVHVNQTNEPPPIRVLRRSPPIPASRDRWKAAQPARWNCPQDANRKSISR